MPAKSIARAPWPVTSEKYGNVTVLVVPRAESTADQSVSMVERSLDVIFADFTAATSALYAVVRSVVCVSEGELVYSASNWPSSVVSVAMSVPFAFALAFATTRLSSNDRSAEPLLGERPSV